MINGGYNEVRRGIVSCSLIVCMFSVPGKCTLDIYSHDDVYILLHNYDNGNVLNLYDNIDKSTEYQLATKKYQVFGLVVIP